MAVTINAKGTASSTFTIGKQGTTLHQGDAVLASIAAEGDFWFDSTTGSLQYKGSVPTVWRNLVFDDISFLDDSIISLTGDATIALSDDIFITPASGSDVVVGTAGSGRIESDPGEDIVVAAGNDLILQGSSGSVVLGVSGNMELTTDSGQSLTITAPSADLIIQGLTYPDTDGTAGQVLTTDGAGTLSWVTVVGGLFLDPTPKTSSFAANAGFRYYIDTSGSAFTMTLPLNPTVGDRVGFVDYAGTFATNNLTVGRNGSLILGTASDLTRSTDNITTILEYSGASRGWIYA